jgi:hypothetical protein
MTSRVDRNFIEHLLESFLSLYILVDGIISFKEKYENFVAGRGEAGYLTFDGGGITLKRCGLIRTDIFHPIL